MGTDWWPAAWKVIMQEALHLCHLDDLKDNQAKGFDPQDEGKDSMFIVRKGTRVFAYYDQCPHYDGSTTLAWRRHAYLNSKAEVIVCAAHGAEFEVDTGLCIHGPCIGESLVGVPILIEPCGNIYLSNV